MKIERRKVWIAQLLILIISFVGKFLSESSLTASCEDVSVIEGQSINLTCTFSENVERLHKDFKIEFHSEKHDKPFPVLLCHWSQSRTRDCYEPEGYSYAGHEGNTVKFNIHQASLEDNGKYACVLLSYSRHDTSKLCSLTVQAPKDVSLSAPIQLTDKIPPATETVEDKDTFGSVKWELILGALTVVIIILLIIVIILFIKRRLASQTGDERNEQGHETAPLNTTPENK